MMTPEEVATLLMRIAAIDNRSITPETAGAWELMLKPYVTLTDATRAYIDFYADPKWADNPRRPWIMPADINKRVSQMMSRRRASDYDIQKALDGRTDGLDEHRQWWVPLQVGNLTATGMGLNEAVEQALAEGRRRQLEAPTPQEPAKPRHPPGRHVASGMGRLGALNLANTIGDTK